MMESTGYRVSYGYFPGKSQLKKLAAATAIPLPKIIPASALMASFAKENIKPPTTIATKTERSSDWPGKSVPQMIDCYLPRARTRLEKI
jgi:hypothetical protein